MYIFKKGVNTTERYVINTTRKVLHKQSCIYAVSAYETNENTSLPALLAAYGKTLDCCGHCLKKDSYVQELVKQHNDKFYWHPKQKNSIEEDHANGRN